MKRMAIVGALLMIVAVAVYAATSITVNPSEMKNGETKTLVDGSNTITVSRDGNDVHIKIEGGANTRSLTVNHAGDGTIRIDRDGPRAILGPDGPRLMIDGMNLPSRPFGGARMQTWFVCPKDHTMLRVPAGKENETFKCPIDGTTMEKRKGHGFGFFFDDDSFESESL